MIKSPNNTHSELSPPSGNTCPHTKGWKTSVRPHRDLDMTVHKSIIHDSLKRKQPIYRSMNGYTKCSHHTKEHYLATKTIKCWLITDESENMTLRENQSQKVSYHTSLFIWNVRIVKSIEIESRLVSNSCQSLKRGTHKEWLLTDIGLLFFKEKLTNNSKRQSERVRQKGLLASGSQELHGPNSQV